ERSAKHGTYRLDGLSVEETRAVGESNGYAGDEYAQLRRIRKAKVLQRHVLKYVFRQVVNEYRQQRKAAPEVDAVDAFCRSRHVPLAHFARPCGGGCCFLYR